MNSYLDFNKLFGLGFSDNLNKMTEEYFNKIVEEYYENHHDRMVIIIAGSESDSIHCEVIQKYLSGIYSKIYYASAHKHPERVIQILDYYFKNPRKYIIITCAGRSNALSGFVAARSPYPVIACPVFKDNTDMLVNIHSTIQMPSNVPVMTILEPVNVGLAVKKILKL